MNPDIIPLLNMKSNEIGQQTKELIGDKREMDVS
jgi:hypothetical protein